MSEALSRRDYARHVGVTRGALKMWIARGKLTPPALLPNGLIDVEQADAQLRLTLNLSRHIGQGGSAGFINGIAPPHPPGPVPSPATAMAPDDIMVARQMQRARAVSASIDAERKRRELNAERGRYVLAQQVAAEWTKALSAFLQSVELSFPELVTRAGLDRGQVIALRQWWREQRQQNALRFAAEAEAMPEYVEDAPSGNDRHEVTN